MFKVVAVDRDEFKMSNFTNVTKIELNVSTQQVTITYGASNPTTHSYSNRNFNTYIMESGIDDV